jgi:hypothetical protein
MPHPSNDLNSVLARCEAFIDFQLWPVRHRVNPQGWLKNFKADEMPYALTLLNAFIYYPTAFTQDVLRHSFNDLSRDVVSSCSCFSEAKHQWAQFLRDLYVCRVTGETPNDTDSGYLMVRLVRQRIGIEQRMILGPEQLFEHLLAETSRNVVFVDDIVGSGNQFVETWNREYTTTSGRTSFGQLQIAGRGHKFYYLPLIAAKKGADRIRREIPAVVLRPAHELGPEYNCLDPNSPIWPEDLKPNVQSVIKNASNRAGIPEADWQGFANLGLAFAFEHSTPDATIPLFHWARNNWVPLIIRS